MPAAIREMQGGCAGGNRHRVGRADELRESLLELRHPGTLAHPAALQHLEQSIRFLNAEGRLRYRNGFHRD